MSVKTFHIKKRVSRTTISLERTLMEILSLHLCGRIDRAVVAKWCQEQVDEDPGAYEKAASQRLAARAAIAIAPKELQERYWDLALAETQKARPKPKGKRRR
jgi:hypothetical protein